MALEAAARGRDGRSYVEVWDCKKTVVLCRKHGEQLWPPDIRPRARRGDPDTSHAAAELPRQNSKLHETILKRLRAHRLPLSDEQIFRQLGWNYPRIRFSASGVRSRRSELVRLGKVRRAPGDGVTTAGNRCARWELNR